MNLEGDCSAMVGLTGAQFEDGDSVMIHVGAHCAVRGLDVGSGHDASWVSCHKDELWGVLLKQMKLRLEKSG